MGRACRRPWGNVIMKRIFLARQHQQTAIWPQEVMGDLVLNAIGIVTVAIGIVTVMRLDDLVPFKPS